MDHFTVEERNILRNSGLNNYPYDQTQDEMETYITEFIDLAMLYKKCGEFYKSLRFWNIVLVHSSKGTYRDLVYRERSKIYYKMKLYKHCLHNIRMSVKYYGRTKELAIRKKLCERKIANHGYKKKVKKVNKAENFLKLSYARNPKIPFIVNCLEVQNSYDGKRNKIKTTQDLEVGDILAIEKPFYTALFSKNESVTDEDAENDLIFKTCYHCHKDNYLDLIKCIECEEVMFCSEKCRRNSFKMYHKYECFISRDAPQYFDFLCRGMRTFFYALYLFNHKIKDFKEFILSRGRARKTIFDFDWRKMNSIERGRNLLLCYDSLTPSKACYEQRPFYSMFEHHPLLIKMWEEEEEFIDDFLHRHYNISAMFNNELWKFPADTIDLIKDDHNLNIQTVKKKIGDGCYVLTSMFNHSCVPNVELYCDSNNRMHLIACQNIPAGKQLCVSYKRNIIFSDYTDKDRVDELHKEFGFYCRCPACVYDNGPVCQFTVKNKFIFEQILALDLHLEDYNVKQLRRMYASLINMMKEHFEQFPCAEWFVLHNYAMITLDHTNRPAQTYQKLASSII